MELDETFDSGIPNSTPAELRTPATAEDIREHARYQRTLESLERRYAEEKVKEGEVVRMHVEGARDCVALCLTLTQVDGIQVHNRKARGW